MIKIKGFNTTILILSFFFISQVFAQDPSFTQPLSTYLYTNPALTGFFGQSRIQASQRNQWPITSRSFFTTYIGADLCSKNNKLGFGMYSLYDNAPHGVLKSFSQNLTLAYQIPLADKVGFRFGLNMGLTSRKLETGSFAFSEQVDSRYSFIYGANEEIPSNSRILFPNLGVGVALHGERFMIGYSFDHLNKPNQNFFLTRQSKLRARHLAHGALRIYQKDENKYVLSLTGLYIIQQDFHQQAVGISGSFKSFNAALMYRNKDAAILCFGYVGKRILARYSYDITISRLTNQTRGAHEICLGFLLGQRKENLIGNEWIKNLF